MVSKGVYVVEQAIITTQSMSSIRRQDAAAATGSIIVVQLILTANNAQEMTDQHQPTAEKSFQHTSAN